MADAAIKIDLTDSIDELKNYAEEVIARALWEVGNDAVNYVAELVPVDTGLLRNSITFAVGGQSAQISSYRADKNDNNEYKSDSVGSYRGTMGQENDHTVYIGTNVEYARDVEFEEIKHRVGQAHYLRDGISNHLDQYKRILKEVLNEG